MNILDTLPEEAFDRVTRLAADLFEVPIAIVSLVDADRQWFKSCFGLDVSQTDRDVAFCSHAILSDEVLQIPDALADPRFAENPLVIGEPRIRFYAGAPLIVQGGMRLGTLCLIDRVARPALSAREVARLRILAQTVVDALLRHREIAKHRQAKTALNEAQAQFRSAFENAPHGMSLTGLDGRYLRVNDAFCRFLGYSAEELLERNYASVTYQDDRAESVEHTAAILDGRDPRTALEKRYVRKDGKVVWGLASISAVRNSDGEPRYVVAQVKDIQERKDRDAEIQRLKERSDLAIRASQIGIWEWQIETGLHIWDEQVRNHFEIDERSVPRTLEEVLSRFHPEDRLAVASRLQAALHAQQEYDQLCRIVLPDDRVRYIKMKAAIIRDHAGRPIRLIGTTEDVSDYHSLLNSSAEAEVRNRAIIENVVDAIISFDPDGTILSYNPASEAIFGHSAEEAIGNNIQMLLSAPIALPDGAHPNTPAAQIVGSTSELEAIRKNGEAFPIELSISRIDLPDGRHEYTGIARDISERRHMETMKNEFISTVNHELRTPLTSIRASLGILKIKANGRLDSKGDRLLDIALHGSERLAVLIDDILDIEKIAAGRMGYTIEPCDIAELCADIVAQSRSLAETSGIAFDLQIAVGQVYCRLDPSRFSQALGNLLSNAAKFSPPGKTVTITLAQPEPGTVAITVADEGPGIPQSFHDKIFQRFAQADSSATRAKGGSGLGLNIAKSIIEAFDGRLTFETEEGQGTAFTFTLPTCQQQQVEEPPLCRTA